MDANNVCKPLWWNGLLKVGYVATHGTTINILNELLKLGYVATFGRTIVRLWFPFSLLWSFQLSRRPSGKTRSDFPCSKSWFIVFFASMLQCIGVTDTVERMEFLTSQQDVHTHNIHAPIVSYVVCWVLCLLTCERCDLGLDTICNRLVMICFWHVY